MKSIPGLYSLKEKVMTKVLFNNWQTTLLLPPFIIIITLMAACSPATPWATTQITATPRPRLLSPGELQIAADSDDIPAIFARDDLFVDVHTGNQEWPQDELIIGLEVNGQARAYPVRLLSFHEIVNDVVGGQPVAITWCPLCYSALVYNRIVDGRELTFGVSGYLYHNNLVMYDHQTNTLWSQLLTQAIRGAQRGAYLEALPSTLMSWSEWQIEHPQTSVLSASRMSLDASSIIDPYAGYYQSQSAGIMGSEFTDERLPAKELIVGLRFGDRTRTYPVEVIRSIGLLNDKVDNVWILLVYSDEFESVFVYEAKVKNTHLNFEFDLATGLMRDIQSDSLWNLQTGEAVSGTYRGEKLNRMVSPLVFWFAWADIYPETELFQP